eukprot:snap_masked-scaffold_50-processed-gene-1.47-mRNA-1 protein AED:0.00 eAED:0.00 QI:434/1/1/1/0.33/0.25/4/85/92
MLPEFEVLRSFVCSFSGVKTLGFAGVTFADTDFGSFSNLILRLPQLTECSYPGFIFYFSIIKCRHNFLLDGTVNADISWKCLKKIDELRTFR